MDSYVGEYRIALDDKGRMRIPNKIKSQFKDNAVTISVGADGSLLLMTKNQFDDRMAELAKVIKQSDTKKNNAWRLINSSLFVPEEDAQGRFVLPTKLKTYAGINKKVVFLGSSSYVEIWAEEKYDSTFVLSEASVNSAFTELGM